MNKTYRPDKLTIDQMHSCASDARAAGHSHYFSGKPCKNGHICPRYVRAYQCRECLRQNRKKYYKPHPRTPLTAEEKAKKQKEYYQTNRKKILQQNKQYNEANKDKIKAQKHEYWKKNKKVLTQKTIEYYHANIEQERARSRKRVRKNSKENNASSFVASATLMDLAGKNYSTDTKAGLDWLDLDQTIGKSWGYVDSQFGVGGLYEGWRFATATEFEEMIDGELGVDTSSTLPTYIGWSTSYQGIVDTLAPVLGLTYSSSSTKYAYGYTNEMNGSGYLRQHWGGWSHAGQYQNIYLLSPKRQGVAILLILFG